MGDTASRLFASFEGDLKIAFEAAYDNFLKMTDSPIEALLGASLWNFFNMSVIFAPVTRQDTFLACCSQQDADKYPDHLYVMMPQFRWEQYRIDWAILTRSLTRNGKDFPPSLLFIECDGHDFHERTKEQAQRDRSRDRAIQAAGIPILRFTGREIYKDPASCAVQVYEFLGNQLKRMSGETE